MTEDTDDWRPGSFTKHFAWGKETGLNKLYDCIRQGFGMTLADVPRDVFRQRISGDFNFYIAANFFLFSKSIASTDYLIVDELVFQAITSPYSRRFDMIALFAFNFSYAGKFHGATAAQRRPALWAHWYVRDRVASQLNWQSPRIDANDIAGYIFSDPRYKTAPSRKVATNLNNLYYVGHLSSFATQDVERWWIDCFFLALDRLIEDRLLDADVVQESAFKGMIDRSGFQQLTGKPSLAKALASNHLLRLYTICGNRHRFFEDAVKIRIEMYKENVEAWLSPNDIAPIGAIHPSSVKIIKMIPAFCATLAAFAGFEILSSLALEDLDVEAYSTERMRLAFEQLNKEGIKPTMTAEALLKETREK